MRIYSSSSRRLYQDECLLGSLKQNNFIKYKRLLGEPRAKSGLSKQLLSNFLAENSYDRNQLEAGVRSGVAY